MRLTDKQTRVSCNPIFVHYLKKLSLHLGVGGWKVLGKLSVQVVSKISKLCDPDPPTSQTDR